MRKDEEPSVQEARGGTGNSARRGGRRAQSRVKSRRGGSVDHRR